MAAASVGCRRRMSDWLPGVQRSEHLHRRRQRRAWWPCALGRSGYAQHSHTIHVLHKRGIDTAVARPPVPPIQPEETRVGRVEETCVDPLVHGLEDRDVSDRGRWAKIAPLHAGAYDA